jgi:hypothetical protein
MYLITDNGNGCTVEVFTDISFYNASVESINSNQFATLEASDLPSTPPEYWTVESNVITVDTVTYDDERSDYIIEQLYKAAMDRQESICDANFMQLIGDGRVIKRTITSSVLPKVDACLAHLDTLWDEYYNRKSNLTENYDFSSIGSMPNTYAEVRAEIEAI